jgi:hypothetical protein
MEAPVTSWKSKKMSARDRDRFEPMFEDLYVALGSPADMAMFAALLPADDDWTIFVYGDDGGRAEALLPGGWADAKAPTRGAICFLVGHADAPDRLGIKLGG